MPAALQFDWAAKVVTVPSPDTSVEMQYLVNQVREEEARLENLDKGVILSPTETSGKVALDAETATGITAVLVNNWQLAFAAQAGPSFARCTTKGGNIAGGIAGEPIKVTAYTQVKQVQSAAATLVYSTSGGGSQPEDVADAVWAHTKGAVLSALAENKCKLDRATGILTVYADDGTTVLRRLQLYSADNFTVPYDGTLPMHSREVAP